MIRKLGPGREFPIQAVGEESHLRSPFLEGGAAVSHDLLDPPNKPQRSSTTSPWLKELQRKFEGGAKAQQEAHSPCVILVLTRARRNLCPLQTSRTRTKMRTAEKQKREMPQMPLKYNRRQTEKWDKSSRSSDAPEGNPDVGSESFTHSPLAVMKSAISSLGGSCVNLSRPSGRITKHSGALQETCNPTGAGRLACLTQQPPPVPGCVTEKFHSACAPRLLRGHGRTYPHTALSRALGRPLLRG